VDFVCLVVYHILSSLLSIIESITVVTCDGRLLVGILVGHDQVQNLILNEAQERIYSEEECVEIQELGCTWYEETMSHWWGRPIGRKMMLYEQYHYRQYNIMQYNTWLEMRLT